jgi:hypothetical protein
MSPLQLSPLQLPDRGPQFTAGDRFQEKAWSTAASSSRTGKPLLRKRLSAEKVHEMKKVASKGPRNPAIAKRSRSIAGTPGRWPAAAPALLGHPPVAAAAYWVLRANDTP